MKINNPKNKVSIKSQSGLTLIEIMIAVVLLSLVIAGISEFFSQLKNNTKQQDTQMELSENLRIAMTNITDQLRNTDFAVPGSKLNEWLPSTAFPGSQVANIDFTTNPLLTLNPNPDTADIITIASANATPASFLQNSVPDGSSTLQLTGNGNQFNSTGRGLISINFREVARVQSVQNNQLTITTDPGTNTGTRIQNHFQNSPIFLVNLTQFWVNQNNNTLLVNRFDGQGNQVLAEGVKNLKFTPINGSTKHFQITLTGVSLEVDQDLGTVIEKDLVSEIVILN